jgi:hypothetical protein
MEAAAEAGLAAPVPTRRLPLPKPDFHSAPCGAEKPDSPAPPACRRNCARTGPVGWDAGCFARVRCSPLCIHRATCLGRLPRLSKRRAPGRGIVGSRLVASLVPRNATNNGTPTSSTPGPDRTGDLFGTWQSCGVNEALSAGHARAQPLSYKGSRIVISAGEMTVGKFTSHLAAAERRSLGVAFAYSGTARSSLAVSVGCRRPGERTSKTDCRAGAGSARPWRRVQSGGREHGPKLSCNSVQSASVTQIQRRRPLRRRALRVREPRSTE